MDKKIESINIEKNKELFEYEMTEVILKLKGEFASFSGEGTMFEDSKVTDEDLRLELHSLQEVEIDKYTGEVPTIKKLPIINLKRVVINSEGKSKPVIQIDGFKKVQIKDVKKEDIRVLIPNTNYRFGRLDLNDTKTGVTDGDTKPVVTVPNVNMNYSELDEVEIIKREVSIPKAKYDFKKLQLKLNESPDIRRTEFTGVPRISLPWESSLGKVKRFVMSAYNIPRIAVGLKKEDFAVEIEKPMITVDMPSIANSSLTVAPVKADKIRIDVSSTSIVCKYSELDEVEIIKREVSIPKTKYDFKKLQLKLNKSPDIRRTEFTGVPMISLSWESSSGKVKRFVMPVHNISRIAVGLKKEDFAVEIEKPMITVDMPSIDSSSLTVDSVKVDKIRIDVPSTSIVCKYEKTENKTELYHFETNVHKFNIDSLEEVVTHKLDLDVVNLVKPKPICIEPVSSRHIMIDVPSTVLTSLGTDSDYTIIRKKNVLSEMPKVPQIKRCVIAEYKPSQKKPMEVTVPHFKNEHLTINTVEVKSLRKVELPGKPNMDEDISRIISLVTNKR